MSDVRDIYDAWEREYFADPGTYRLGQRFIVDFFRRTTDPELFYERDPAKARRMIFERYIDRGFDLVRAA